MLAADLQYIRTSISA